MSISYEDYQQMADEALRGMLLPALSQVRKRDKDGEHISIFLTVESQAPGVRLPPVAVAQHPDTITLAIQFRFSGLSINRRALTVGLRFDGEWSKVVIPFSAIIQFWDQDAGFVIDFPRSKKPEAVATAASKVVSLAAFREART
ncbi:ClpXP protease specificity-enhancing factor SspB [Brevundimonas diminuta]|uniref:ClpXP protease specificity-enhancing factor SspB n=1 Tax=Brevundimonas diminuta TaxID=293 RepID=UPI0022AFE802|nr:ClpXP protease specificity-enhancing factor SspB [Brevundimonas diminuta]MCZ4109567.1 ClpXP protease specificity-enhancing factor SspB [Brevundimonas diminuta]